MGGGGFSEDFKYDPWGHGGSQAGHFCIGLWIWLVAFVAWPVAGEWVSIGVGAAYFIVIEWAWQRLNLFWDSVEDAAHVTVGASFGYAFGHYPPHYALVTLSLWGAVIIFGMVRRS